MVLLTSISAAGFYCYDNALLMSLIGVGGAQLIHFVWKKSKKKYIKHILLCEHAHSLMQQAWINNERLYSQLWYPLSQISDLSFV